MYSHGIT